MLLFWPAPIYYYLTLQNRFMSLNISSAGGLCLTQEVGDIVISNEVCQHDFDIYVFPKSIEDICEVPGLPQE